MQPQVQSFGKEIFLESSRTQSLPCTSAEEVQYPGIEQEYSEFI